MRRRAVAEAVAVWAACLIPAVGFLMWIAATDHCFAPGATQDIAQCILFQ